MQQKQQMHTETNRGGRRATRTVTGAMLLLGAMAALSGCHIDQWAQPKIKPYYESDFFSDRQSSRPLVSHTVPVGPIRADDPAYFTGYVNRKAVATTPVKAVRAFVSPKEMLLRGQDRYNAFCSPCHGMTGDGNGFIMQRGLGYWQKLAASYHTTRLRQAPDGYIYDVLVNGHGVMYGYASRIPNVDDRWAVVNYIRAIQLTRSAPAGAVPPAIERQMDDLRGRGEAPTANPAGHPALNTDPNREAQPTQLADPTGTERPVNRTPGGTREVRPNQPETTPGEKTTP
jgi:mono/diheme cytochrome c family protein